MSGLPARVSVLVVGAGPAGLMTALTLQARGISYALIDAEAPGRNVSRAIVVQAFTMEILAHFGIANRLRARGNTISGAQTSNRKSITSVLDMEQALGGQTPFPNSTVATQLVTETVLHEALVERGGRVWYPAAFSSLQKSRDGYSVRLEHGKTIETQYIVAADGMRSRVREAIGVEWSIDDIRPESVVLADVRLSNAEVSLPTDRSNLFLSPAGFFSAVPMREKGIYRIIAIVDEAKNAPTREDVQALLDSRGPIVVEQIKVEELTWSTRVRIHEQVASTMHVDRRAFLIGDAAHVHSPTGGQGLNISIADGYLLGEALNRVIKHDVSTDELEQWAGERKAVAERVVKMSAGMLMHFKAACSSTSMPSPPAQATAPPKGPNPLFVLAGLIDRPEDWDPYAVAVI